MCDHLTFEKKCTHHTLLFLRVELGKFGSATFIGYVLSLSNRASVGELLIQFHPGKYLTKKFDH